LNGASVSLGEDAEEALVWALEQRGVDVTTSGEMKMNVPTMPSNFSARFTSNASL